MEIILDQTATERIGFPPPLLGKEPIRLSVAQAGEGLLALALPGGLLSEAYPLYAGQASVIAGLQSQLRASKPELERLGMEIALSVNFIEPEVSGLLLVGITRAGVEKWRNALGSQQLIFTYELVAEGAGELPDEVVCDLPIARHSWEERMLVSHKSGKKCQTTFRRQATQGNYSFWTATTEMPRVHQIRLHAMERGLRIPGESLYGKQSALTWSALQGKGGEGEPIVARPLIHLAKIAGGEGFTTVISRPEGRLGKLWAEFASQ